MSIRSRQSPGGRDANGASAEPEGAERSRRSHREKGEERKLLIAVAERLAALRPYELDQLELDPDLRAAVDELTALSGSAKGRQARFLHGLLRDEDLTALTRRLDRGSGSTYVERQTRVDQDPVSIWLTRLLAEGDAAVNDLVDAHPSADRQQLRQLIRTANKRPETTTSERAQRSLRAAIAELLET